MILTKGVKPDVTVAEVEPPTFKTIPYRNREIETKSQTILILWHTEYNPGLLYATNALIDNIL